MKMKFYAAENAQGFANTWDVLVFDSKKSRDEYVAERDGYNHNTQKMVDCRAIKKSQVTEFAANLCLTQNRVIKPRPFSGECWMVANILRDGAEIPGYIGDVYVGYPDSDPGERLF